MAGGTYFFTQTTYHHHHTWLCTDMARTALRNAINQVRKRYPFTIDALVLLPNHLHCLWTLPPNDDDYTTRWRLLKIYVTKECANQLNLRNHSPPRAKNGVNITFGNAASGNTSFVTTTTLKNMLITFIGIPLNTAMSNKFVIGPTPPSTATQKWVSIRLIGVEFQIWKPCSPVGWANVLLFAHHSPHYK